jgi:hypothetical protein
MNAFPRAPAGLGERRRWIASGVAATAILTGVLALFRAPSRPPASTLAGRPPVQLARPGTADPILREQAEMRDLAPLFLPTERNASLTIAPRDPNRSLLEDQSPKLRFGEAEANVVKSFPPVALVNGRPAAQAGPLDLFSPDSVAASLAGFGREPAPIAPLPPRGGFVEVVASRSGERVLAEPITPAAGPSGEKQWGPVEFLALVDSAGLAAPLSVTAGSRVAEVDAHFSNYLSQVFRVGDRLAPGFYRITVAP